MKMDIVEESTNLGEEVLVEKCTMNGSSLRLYRGSFSVMDQKLYLGVTNQQLKEDAFLSPFRMV